MALIIVKRRKDEEENGEEGLRGSIDGKGLRERCRERREKNYMKETLPGDRGRERSEDDDNVMYISDGAQNLTVKGVQRL